MERQLLKDTCVRENGGSRYAELFCSLSKLHEDELDDGSGNALEEFKYIDSSTALGVNFFLLYEQIHPKANIIFEWDKSSPLKVGGKSNIDIRVQEDKIITFYESKFLEPYYMCNSRFTESYSLKENYYDHWKFTDEELVSILRDFQSFTYYNASQLFRHLLAIVNHIVHNKDLYKDITSVVLNSISWKMEDEYLNLLNLSRRSRSYAIKRRNILKQEETDVKDMIQRFIDHYVTDIIPKDITLSFETSTYNNNVSLINNHKEFKNRYFIR